MILIGAPISHVVTGKFSDRAVLAVGLVLAALSFIVTFNIHDATWDGVCFMLIGPPTICYSVTAGTFLAHATPDRLMGRVGASYGVVQAATTLTGMIAGSVLGQRIGIVTTMNLGAALVAASAPLALRLPPTQTTDPTGQSSGGTPVPTRSTEVAG